MSQSELHLYHLPLGSSVQSFSYVSLFGPWGLLNLVSNLVSHRGWNKLGAVWGIFTAYLNDENEHALFSFTTSQTFENRLLLLWWPALFAVSLSHQWLPRVQPLIRTTQTDNADAVWSYKPSRRLSVFGKHLTQAPVVELGRQSGDGGHCCLFLSSSYVFCYHTRASRIWSRSVSDWNTLLTSCCELCVCGYGCCLSTPNLFFLWSCLLNNECTSNTETLKKICYLLPGYWLFGKNTIADLHVNRVGWYEQNRISRYV